jgi:hypothetical protein
MMSHSASRLPKDIMIAEIEGNKIINALTLWVRDVPGTAGLASNLRVLAPAVGLASTCEYLRVSTTLASNLY